MRPTVPVHAARSLLLAGQGLLENPGRRATATAVRKQIEAMGFVQVDTINIVIRAHHHILATRFDGYHPRMLEKLLERDRTLFEHWTHDASIVPIRWYGPWKVRFDRIRKRGAGHTTWWHERMEGDPQRVLRKVLKRVRDEGPLMSRDFENPQGKGNTAWWGWKPSKAALEYLWRTGDLSIAARRNFHKLYDITDRVLPEAAQERKLTPAAHLDWAGTAAMERLGVATPAEIAGFLNAISLKDATAWCAKAVKSGAIEAVTVEAADGSKPRPAFAIADWRERAKRITADNGTPMRALSPFDPVVRDRKRLGRLFDFTYTFEAFVPAPKRQYGYYTMPLLDGGDLVGRVDTKLHRAEGELEVRGVWWEKGIKATRKRKAQLDEALDRLKTAALRAGEAN